MKTLLKLGNITVGNVSVSDITIEQEYTAKDVVELAFNGKNFVKELIKELPEAMDDLYVAFNKFNELDKKAEEDHGWTVTEVRHSYVTDEQVQIDYDLALLRNKINMFKNSSISAEDIATEIRILERKCVDAFVHDVFDLDEYVAKAGEVAEVTELFNEMVRSL